MRSNRRLLLAFILPLFINTCYAEKTVKEHLVDGNQFLITGKYNDAIISYDAAIAAQDPSDYLSYYKRATAYLSLGRTSSAIDDFSTILDLRPGFDKALLQRAKLYANDGDFSLAKDDLLKHKDATSQEVKDLLESVQYAEKTSMLGLEAYENKNYDDCIRLMTEVIRIAPQKPQWRLTRSKCHVGKGEIEEATSDLTRVAVLTPSNKDLLLQVASLNFFSLYEPDRALTQVKSCVHYDPDDKQCKGLFRFMKRIEKEIKKASDSHAQQRYATALNALVGKTGILHEIDEPLKTLETQMNAKLPNRLALKVYSLACIIAAESKETDKAEKWCAATLEIDPNHQQALFSRGEMKLNQNDFEGAVHDLEKAFEASEQQDNRIRQMLQRAQQLLRQSKKRDYYKILDVSRDSDPRTIKKAYRKMAHAWHPDKYSGDLDKAQVESKMADINQAYEVLNEEETEPLHHGETIEMSDASSSHTKFNRLAEGWQSVTNLVIPPQQPRSSTHIDEDDPILPLPDIKNQLKRKLYLLLEEPASSRAAFWTNVVVSLLIVFSAVTTTIETIPSFRSAKKVISKHDTTYEFRFTILRLFRLLRLFKSYKYSNAIVMTLEVMMMAFRRSGDALSALFFFTVTCVVLFSTLLYFAERGIWDETLQTFVASDGSPSSFDSIPAAFWFVLVTITTTGYGDMVPTTFIGKLITFPAMMFGVLLIALPSIIVGRNFTIVWESMRRRQFSNRMGTNPMGGGEDILAHETPVTTSGPETNFGILPNNNEDEILNQIQQLLALTLQNQSSINRIMSVLEPETNTSCSNHKGKAPMLSSTREDPFEE
ncbi:hypothetical protein INT48_004766 [Thamnidium elegans]|uniref:Tetratricopeptide repeat and J domain-containing co-chaperone DNJ1 n=1 Tax=Thamnidium elegans TaxID=101142 RepID=A0A8H7VSI0_9FUNG|nr:hypothetical protein INT48_004766 [Thamnidium elegans]